MYRHPQTSRLRRYRMSKRIGAFVLLLGLTAGLVALGDPSTCPRGDSLEAFALIATPNPGTGQGLAGEEAYIHAADFSEIAQTVDQRLLQGSSALNSARTENVRAGRFLEVRARVTGPSGRAIPGSKVIFVWRQGPRVTYDAAPTDDSGVARVLHWIAAEQRGVRTVLVVSADNGLGSATAYTWFIPE
jgi:hypothetical protein